MEGTYEGYGGQFINRSRGSIVRARSTILNSCVPSLYSLYSLFNYLVFPQLVWFAERRWWGWDW